MSPRCRSGPSAKRPSISPAAARGPIPFWNFFERLPRTNSPITPRSAASGTGTGKPSDPRLPPRWSRTWTSKCRAWHGTFFRWTGIGRTTGIVSERLRERLTPRSTPRWGAPSLKLGRVFPVRRRHASSSDEICFGRGGSSIPGRSVSSLYRRRTLFGDDRTEIWKRCPERHRTDEEFLVAKARVLENTPPFQMPN